ncbi:MAG: hypothetical protein H8E17_09695 [Deltaproteobacteria bacterium]|nr:hypothetical protein [Deltaproteobacteria bacterium]
MNRPAEGRTDRNWADAQMLASSNLPRSKQWSVKNAPAISLGVLRVLGG